SVIAQLPESPACVASGIAEANALYAAALMSIPNGPAKTAGVAVGQAAAAAIIALRTGDGSETTTWLAFKYPQGTPPRRMAIHPRWTAIGVRVQLWRRQAVRPAAQRAVLARSAVSTQQQEIRGRLQRDQADWRR